jgi:DHA3 family macrolide efflux protein-like MFS transporter
MPAKAAAVPAVVPAESLQVANAFSAMTQSIMPMAGLSLSASVLGIIYDQFPEWFFFTSVCLNTLSFVGSAFFIQRLPAILPQRQDVQDSHPITDFKEGIRFIRNRRDLVVMTILLTFFRLMVAPFFVVYVAANKLWFGGKPQPIAWWEFCFFVGMVCASAVIGKMTIRRPGVAFSSGLGFVGLTVIAFAGAIPLQNAMNAAGMPTLFFGLTVAFWVFVASNLLAGLGVAYADIPINTYMQMSVPDAFRGRVNSVQQMVATGVMPIGMAMGGFLVDSIGVVGTFILMGTGMTLACFAGLLDPVYRNIRNPEPGASSVTALNNETTPATA